MDIGLVKATDGRMERHAILTADIFEGLTYVVDKYQKLLDLKLLILSKIWGSQRHGLFEAAAST
jgi:hypothetical protein